MRRPSFTTIITPLIPERVEAVRSYLRQYAEPHFDARSLLRCQSRFRFDNISGLHFCSFVVLEGDGKYAPCLVFEATFDGQRGDFLRELWRVAPQGMHEVYVNCVGYPESGLAVPELVEEYLSRHEAGAQTYFLGSPGRLVSQIRGESLIRSKLVRYFSRRSSIDDANVTTLAALQQGVQREIIRARPQNRWAEEPAALPWEMTYRNWIAAAAVLVALLALCGVGMLVLALCGKGSAAVDTGLHAVFDYAWQLGAQLMQVDGVLGNLTTQLQLPVLPVVIALGVIWLILRIGELLLRQVTDDPRDQYFIRRYPLHLLVIVIYALPIFLIGFAVVGFYREASGGAPVSSPVTLALLVGIGLIWLLLRYWATSLRLAVELQELSSLAENWRRFVLDLVRFAMLIAVVTAALAIARHIPTTVSDLIGKSVVPLTYVVLGITVYAVAGILTFYAVAFCLFLIVRAYELIDLARFQSAEVLVTRPVDNTAVYSREEGGINRYQNHLASLTYVKPGRRWLVRPTLFVINLLCRFWFNRGELGGIPTILSARWVLIDRGRRLLFLDNYSGAWNSYLNEFIDMGAVKGLNAIWSNTFVKAAGVPYAWPDTKFYFWQGAQAEPPFKAYVRQSQIHTIVWYSAYPHLSITNINMNTELRQSLFSPLSTCDLDRIGNSL
jgi:hypothetical protein